jgi:hypothetical protein
MPAGLEEALRAIRPRCETTDVHPHAGGRPTHPSFTSCPRAATHAVAVQCAGSHEPYPVRLMCGRHHASLVAQLRRSAPFSCGCGRPARLRMEPL